MYIHMFSMHACKIMCTAFLLYVYIISVCYYDHYKENNYYCHSQASDECTYDRCDNKI